MRPPLVKRHTPPESGFLAFFPPSGAWRSQQTVACSDVIAVHGCRLTWLHHTRLAVLSPLARRLQNSIRLLCCARETALFPQTVRCKDRAQRVDGVQGERGAGEEQHTRAGSADRRITQERERRANHSAGRRVLRPLRALACNDAVDAAGASASCRCSPELSSAAPGAPAPRHDRWKHVSLSKAPGRLRL